MKDFIIAALPWVVMGIALAIFASKNAKMSQAREAGEVDEEAKARLKNQMTQWMCIGLVAGVFISSAFKNVSTAIGVSFGALIGMLIGTFFGMRPKK